MLSTDLLAKTVEMQSQLLQEDVGTIGGNRQMHSTVDVIDHLAKGRDGIEVGGVRSAADGRGHELALLVAILGPPR